jgi:hypothetical protein
MSDCPAIRSIHVDLKHWNELKFNPNSSKDRILLRSRSSEYKIQLKNKIHDRKFHTIPPHVTVKYCTLRETVPQPNLPCYC